MTNTRIDNIKLAASKFKNVMIHIDEFCNLLQVSGTGIPDCFQPITEKEVLRTGYYGNIYDAKLFVSKTVAPETIKVSNSDTPDVKDESQWSKEVGLNNEFDIEQYK